MQLSKNFSLQELLRSNKALELDIENKPNAQQLINLVYTAQMLESIRAEVDAPVYVTSGFRTKALNDVISKSTTSLHMQGLAADIYVKNMTATTLFGLIKSSSVNYSRMILEFPKSKTGGWVHIESNGVLPSTNKRHLLAERKNGKIIYTRVA